MALQVSRCAPLPAPPCAVSPACPIHVVPTAPTGRSPASRGHTGASLFWKEVGELGGMGGMTVAEEGRREEAEKQRVI